MRWNAQSKTAAGRANSLQALAESVWRLKLYSINLGQICHSMKALFLALSAIALTSLIPLRAADSTPAASVATVTVTAPDPDKHQRTAQHRPFHISSHGRNNQSVDRILSHHGHGRWRSRLRDAAWNGDDPSSISASLLVTPIADKLAENAETVIVTLSSPGLALTLGSAVALPTYTIGDPSSATVTIKDSIQGRGPLPTVSIAATAPNAAEPSKSGAITISRIGSLSNAFGSRIRHRNGSSGQFAHDR